jgi:hypothetical protein
VRNGRNYKTETLDDLRAEIFRWSENWERIKEKHRIEQEEWDRRKLLAPPPEPIKTSELDCDADWHDFAEALADYCDEEGIDYPGKQYRWRKPKPHYTDNVLPFVLRKIRREDSW